MRVFVLCLASLAIAIVGCGDQTDAPSQRTDVGGRQPSTISSPGGDAVASDSNDASDEGNDAVDLSAQGVLDDAIAAAKAADKKLFVHFGAQW